MSKAIRQGCNYSTCKYYCYFSTHHLPQARNKLGQQTLRWNVACSYLLTRTLGNATCGRDRWEPAFGTGRNQAAIWPTAASVQPMVGSGARTAPVNCPKMGLYTTRLINPSMSMSPGHARKGLGLGSGSSLQTRQSLKELTAEG